MLCPGEDTRLDKRVKVNWLLIKQAYEATARTFYNKTFWGLLKFNSVRVRFGFQISVPRVGITEILANSTSLAFHF